MLAILTQVMRRNHGSVLTTSLSLTQKMETVLFILITLTSVDTGTTTISQLQSHVAHVGALVADLVTTFLSPTQMGMIVCGTQTSRVIVDNTIPQISLRAKRVVPAATEEALLTRRDTLIGTLILMSFRLVKMILQTQIQKEIIALGTLTTHPIVEIMMTQISQLLMIAALVVVDLSE